MSLTTTAAVLRSADGRFGIEDLVLDPIGPDELLVRIAGAGMCHTDLIARSPGFADILLPAVLGHEGAGVVEAVGDGITDFAVGDHVVLSFESCGGCPQCRDGQPAYCQEFGTSNMSGRRRDGSSGATGNGGSAVNSRWFGQSSFATFAVATERNAVKVDPGLPLELLGPLGCGLQTGAGAVLNEMDLRPGQSIAVFGAGAVGLAAVMAAKLAGASDIVVVDLHRERLEIARELGATRVYPGDQEDLAAAIIGDGNGVDHSLDTTSVPAVMATAVAVLAPRGGAVLVGGGPGLLTLHPSQLAGRRLTYVLEGSADPREFIPVLIGHWRAGRFPFDRLVRTYPLAEIDRAEADSLSGATIKPVLIPDRD